MKKITALVLSMLMAFSFAACTNEGEKQESSSSKSEEVSIQSESQDTDTVEEISSHLRIAALKGPTGMGLASLLEDEESKNSYAFTLASSPTEIVPLISQKKVDLASLPANLGAVLSDKVKVIAINTVGNLNFITKNEEINNISDLKGKTVITSGKGASPEAMLNFLLEKNGLKPGEDVKTEYRNEHSECLAALLQSEKGIALLPQPFATVALSKDESLKTALDFNELWKEATGGIIPVTGIMTVSNEYLENNKEAVDNFLNSYEESINAAASGDEKAVKAIASLGIAEAGIAKKALPYCGIRLIKGEEMKKALISYYEILEDFEPKLIGGKMPSEEIYYLG